MKYLRSSAPETGSAGSEGLSYVYVLPCAYEDLLKLGFSRDPRPHRMDLRKTVQQQ